MITIVHYGAGNIRSVSKAFETVGASVKITENPKDIEKAEKLVLPGVGAFGKAVKALEARQLIQPMQTFISMGRPFLGICLGMHLLFPSSEEDPEPKGLSLIDGSVKRFPKKLKVPHLGWNQVMQTSDSPLWKGIPDKSFFYFAHSYFVKTKHENIISGQTEYQITYTSSIRADMIFGVQFHPEKSQKWGLKILENFSNL